MRPGAPARLQDENGIGLDRGLGVAGGQDGAATVRARLAYPLSASTIRLPWQPARTHSSVATPPWALGPHPKVQERLCIAPAQRGPDTAFRTARAHVWKSTGEARGESAGPNGSSWFRGGAESVVVVAWSVISPMPAYSRTAAMPATASVLVSKGFDNAMMVPSGAVSRNLKADSASTYSSNIPAIMILSVRGTSRLRRCGHQARGVVAHAFRVYPAPNLHQFSMRPRVFRRNDARRKASPGIQPK